MSAKTGIQWTESTWNCLTGCTRVSPGCENCYAERLAATRLKDTPRYQGLALMKPQGPRWTGKVRLHEDLLDQPLRWRKPRRIFVNSMSDLFHEDVPFDFIDKVFAVMALAPRHTFQVLTKRPERMLEYVTERAKSAKWLEPIAREFGYTTRFTGPDGRDYGIVPWPLPNVWLGVSVEDQKRADDRIPLLLQTPAAVRFVSCEPLLGPVDLNRGPVPFLEAWWPHDRMTGPPEPYLDWVISGGESGPCARPSHPDWFRSLRDQCQAAGVAFFFKQWGEWAPGENAPQPQTRTARVADYFGGTWSFGTQTVKQTEEGHIDDEPTVYRVGTKAAGRLLDGAEHNGMPEGGA